MHRKEKDIYHNGTFGTCRNSGVDKYTMISLGCVNSFISIMSVTYLINTLGMREIFMDHHPIEFVSFPEEYNRVKDLMIGMFCPILWILLQLGTLSLET